MKRLAVVLICLALGASAASAEAQPVRKVYRIGVLNMGTSVSDPETEAFLDGLRDHGHEVGRNVVVEIRGGSTSPPRRSNTDCRPCSGTESTSTPGG